MEPINTVKGLFVLLVITIAAICVLSPSSARKIDVKVAISYQKAKEAPFPKKSTALDFVFSDLPKD